MWYIDVLDVLPLYACIWVLWLCSYFLLMSLTHSYPAVKRTMAISESIREKVLVTRHCEKMIQRFFEDHVNSI